MCEDLHEEIDALARDVERTIAETALRLERYEFDAGYPAPAWSREFFL